MKIRKLTPEMVPKAASLLDHAFAPSKREVQLFDKLHENGRTMYEWVCIVRDRVVAYIGLTNAYDGTQVVGLHLGPLAVQPQMRGQGIGSELLRFALRQEGIKERTIFVLGEAKFFQKFGFEQCTLPICPSAQGTGKFLIIRNELGTGSRIGYEPEFMSPAPGKKRRKKVARGKA